MEPRVVTRLSPDLTAQSIVLPSRDAILIAPFFYKDTGIDDGDGIKVLFSVTRNRLLLTGMKLYVDDVLQTYTASSTPGSGEYTVVNPDVVGVKAQIKFGAAYPPASGAVLVAWYMHNEDDDGNEVQNHAFEIITRRNKDYESLFGVADTKNPFGICLNTARQFGLSRFYFIPVPYLESDVTAVTPNPVDITDALDAAKYITASVVCHIFSDTAANLLAEAHCNAMSTDDKAEYRMFFGANSSTTLALQHTELAGYTSKRDLIVCTPNGDVKVSIGGVDYTKNAGYLAWGLVCRQLTFANIANTLTRQSIPGFKLTGKYLRDERESLSDDGGCTVRTIGIDTVQVVWAKTATKSALPEEEESSVVLLQDYVRAQYEDGLDRKFIAKIYGIPREFNGFDENDIISAAVSISIALKRNGLIVSFRDVTFTQNISEPRQLDGSIGVKWPFPTNWIYLTISSYN